ncbi:MAG: PTS sugar transporter subunit IIA, partial [Spirochaetota bacterium]
NEPVRLLVVLLGPEGAHGRHLKLLSRLARLLSSSEFREELLQAPSPEAVLEAFRRREEVAG